MNSKLDELEELVEELYQDMYDDLKLDLSNIKQLTMTYNDLFIGYRNIKLKISEIKEEVH